MDMQYLPEEKLEKLPKRTQFPDHSRERHDRYNGYNYPWARVRRWLEAQVGKHLDKVISEFVHADWIPVTHRTMKQLRSHLEIDTFIEKGEVYYHSDHCVHWHWNDAHKPFRAIKDADVKIFYVHPTTRLICVFHPPTRKSYAKIMQEKKDAVVYVLGDYHQYNKIDGTWYEIKAITSPHWGDKGCYNRKGPKDNLMTKSSFFEENHNKHYPFIKVNFKRQLSHKELKQHNLKNDHPIVLPTCPKCGAVRCNHYLHQQAEKRINRFGLTGLE